MVWTGRIYYCLTKNVSVHSVSALMNESNYCGLSDASLLGVRVALHVHWRWWLFVELALHVPAMGDILLADVATQVC